MAMRRMAHAMSPVVLVVLTACFGYTPLEQVGPLPKRGAPVRALLKTPASVALMGITVDNVILVEGEFVGWEDSALTLSATWLKAVNGREYKAVGETVVLPGQQLDRVERRVVSRPRSAGLVGLGALMSVLAGAALTGGVGGSGPGGTPGGTK